MTSRSLAGANCTPQVSVPRDATIRQVILDPNGPFSREPWVLLVAQTLQRDLSTK
jgi:hypothetical protein